MVDRDGRVFGRLQLFKNCADQFCPVASLMLVHDRGFLSWLSEGLAKAPVRCVEQTSGSNNKNTLSVAAVSDHTSTEIQTAEQH